MNDFHENLLNYHYENMVKKFGRAKVVNNNDIIFFKPKISDLERIYHSLRIFISDNFYMLSHFIAIFENYFSIHNINSKFNYTDDNYITEIRKNKFEKLIKIFSQLTKEKNSLLTLGLVPCTLNSPDMCKNINEYEKFILKISKKYNFKVIPFIKIYDEKNYINKKRISFKNDGHFNIYGHNLFYKVFSENF